MQISYLLHGCLLHGLIASLPWLPAMRKIMLLSISCNPVALPRCKRGSRPPQKSYHKPEHSTAYLGLRARTTLLQASKLQLGVADVQLRLTPLEEVFSAVVRQAEVQHTQHI